MLQATPELSLFPAANYPRGPSFEVPLFLFGTMVQNRQKKSLPADLVVLAMGVRPDRPDYEALREAYGDKLILVGDSCKPGQIYDALHSGHDKAFVY